MLKAVHIDHLGHHSMLGHCIKKLVGPSPTKAKIEGVEGPIEISFGELACPWINLREEAKMVAEMFNAEVQVLDLESSEVVVTVGRSVHLDSLYATFYSGHLVALLQKEGNTSVRQGSLNSDEVYIDGLFWPDWTFDDLLIDGKEETLLVSGNLGLRISEEVGGVPETVHDRNLEDMEFIPDYEVATLLGYEEELSVHDDRMKCSQFVANVQSGAFTEMDGIGHPSRAGMVNKDIEIRPSDLSSIPYDATHVVWYNK